MSLDGIDIARYQKGIDISKVDADFVIIKATEGTSYTSPTLKAQLDSTRKAGRLVGLYHFATGGTTGVQEADHFLAATKGLRDEAVLVLDWEADALKKGPAYAQAFLDRVKAKTGVTPLIYMSASVTGRYDWGKVAETCPLWVAAYGSNQSGGYRVPSKVTIKHWSAPTIRQYTSKGTLSGYAGRLDLNLFYGSKADWNALASKETAKPDVLDVDGSLGPASVTRMQEILGTTKDGIISGQKSSLRRLHTALPAARYSSGGSSVVRALQKKLSVSVSGQLDKATIKAWQKRLGVKADGSLGPVTARAVQRKLNGGKVA